MVYRGKPSEGCHSCRQRRIKCDKKRPGCTQCARSWQECPGYRDKLDVLFKDESKTTARKVIDRRRPSKNLSVRPAQSSTGSSRSSSPPSSTTLSPLTPMPTIVIEDCARAYFMCTYLPGSHFDYLSELFGKVRGESPLAKAVYASALANFSTEHAEPKLLSSARRQYSEALQLTNTALSTPKEAAKDETLAAVLLLSLFEAFVHEGRRVFPRNWTSHVEGAAALLQLRGHKQFETEIGSMLFAHVSANIRVSAAIRRLPLPRDFDRLCKEAVKYHHGDDHQWRLEFLQIVEEFAMMRYVVDQHAITDPQDLISQLLALEKKLLSIVTKMPAPWHYTLTERSEVATGLWLQPMQYPNAKIAQLWDSVRMMRIFLNEAAHRILIGDSYYGDFDIQGLQLARDAILEKTASACEEMGREICAGIHNYLHCSSSPSGRVVLAEASWLLWPLAVAGECHFVSDEVRQFAIDQLQALGKDTRLPQALWAAEMLRERSEDEEWLHIYHVA